MMSQERFSLGSSSGGSLKGIKKSDQTNTIPRNADLAINSQDETNSFEPIQRESLFNRLKRGTLKKRKETLRFDQVVTMQNIDSDSLEKQFGENLLFKR